ncbi:uncharacterized protein LOC113550517 [Rhopalosiphum maidis]|uniref:uncharacterized protein LOC113550517 n=1 Tax=Rhopalosiphum maidis TaxID=43146 RepID=UPI000EFE8275|nr:uncharacterized protein LOC113550517 [Rhopalosiphum maidis]
MPINGNALAKYLVMVSQVIAWCTVSAMLLRRGLNQVNAASQQPPSPSSYDGNKPYGGPDTIFGDSNATSTAATDSDHHQHGTLVVTEKSFGENGAPAVVAGVVMIAIAVIMLIISPTIMVMKMIEKRKKRILDTELESPPKYEDVVESAPRYSSLFVFNNDGEMALVSENIPHKEMDNIQKQLV